MQTIAEFLARRKPSGNEFFPSPGSRRTALVTGEPRWSGTIAFALLRSGCNVLLAEPWDVLFYGDDRRLVTFDNVFRRWAQTIKKFNVRLVIGANAAALVPHPKTGELLHRAAGVPVVNYWWQEPRALPAALARHGGYSPHGYLNTLRDGQVLNVFADADVAEEMTRFLGLPNVAHVPPGADPDLWDAPARPLRERGTLACHVGDAGGGSEEDTGPGAPADVTRWAEQVARLKLDEPERSAVDCIKQVGGPGEIRGSTARRPYELAPTLKEEFDRWAALGRALGRRRVGQALAGVAARLGPDLVIKGAMDSAARRDLYASARAALCLPDPASHGGVPAEAFEIACGRGLLVTPASRELPSLFEPGRECVAFRTGDELADTLDRLRRSPEEFERVVAAGHQRAAAEHTWQNRLGRVLDLARERLGLPW